MECSCFALGVIMGERGRYNILEQYSVFLERKKDDVVIVIGGKMIIINSVRWMANKNLFNG